VFGVSKLFDKVLVSEAIKRIKHLQSKWKNKDHFNDWKQRGKPVYISEGYLPEGYGAHGEAPQVFMLISMLKEMP